MPYKATNSTNQLTQRSARQQEMEASSRLFEMLKSERNGRAQDAKKSDSENCDDDESDRTQAEDE